MSHTSAPGSQQLSNKQLQDFMKHVTSLHQRADRPQPTPDLTQSPYEGPNFRADPVKLMNVTGLGNIHQVISAIMIPPASPNTVAIFLERLNRDAVDSEDMIELMLQQQMAQANFVLHWLHLRGLHSKDARQATAASDAATRLLAEFRRCALALEDYRAKRLARRQQESQATEEAATGADAKDQASQAGCEQTKAEEQPPSADDHDLQVPQAAGTKEKTEPASNGKAKASNGEGQAAKQSTNGQKPKRPANREKNPPSTKQSSPTCQEIPECLNKRANPNPIPAASPQGEEIAASGRE